MLEQIIKTYEAINAELLINTPYNDLPTRDMIKASLERELENCFVKCDEENNPSEVIEQCIAVATVEWFGDEGLHTIDLVFGRPEQIVAVQRL